jgi:hypothetical protein
MGILVLVVTMANLHQTRKAPTLATRDSCTVRCHENVKGFDGFWTVQSEGVRRSLSRVL